jgi:predicted DNA-binding protein with PD1-like motif
VKTKLIHDDGEKTFAIIFDKGDEVASGLLSFAKDNNLSASRFTAIGAFERVTLGFFERERKDYKRIIINEQVEVLSLVGDIALDGDEPKAHAHVVVGKADGTAHGGHLLEARVWPTLEVILVESPRHLRRKLDKETGLALISITG